MECSYLFLAQGFEEIEALTAVDVLRRADIPVKTVSITDCLQVTGAHGMTITADTIFADTDFNNASWLILPGGIPGATNLHEYEPLRKLLLKQRSENRSIAAICAAPAVVLCPSGLLKGRKATCYPGFEDHCTDAQWTGEPVVADKDFVLANGPANAMLWALNIVEQAVGSAKAREVAAGLLFFPNDKNVDFSFG